MTNRKHTPLHDKWHRIVGGQIRDCITSHPEWFNHDPKLVNSLAKRIVGEIVAGFHLVTGHCTCFDDAYSENVTGGAKLSVAKGGVGCNCTIPLSRLDTPEAVEVVAHAIAHQMGQDENYDTDLATAAIAAVKKILESEQW